MEYCYTAEDMKEFYEDGMRAGIAITLKCLKEKMPELFDMVADKLNMALEAPSEVVH